MVMHMQSAVSVAMSVPHHMARMRRALAGHTARSLPIVDTGNPDRRPDGVLRPDGLS